MASNDTVPKKKDECPNMEDLDQVGHLAKRVEELSIKFDGFFVDYQNLKKKVTDDIAEVKDTLLFKVVEASKELEFRLENIEGKLEQLDRQVVTNTQRARENNLELHGISDEVEDHNLISTILSIILKLGVEITVADIQSCHRLPRRKGVTSKPVIVKFVNQNFCDVIFAKRFDLRRLDFSDLFATDNGQVFVSINLSPPYRELDFFCRMLKREGMITASVITHAHVKISVGERSFRIKHLNDLRKLFPQFSFEPTVYSSD